MQTLTPVGEMCYVNVFRPDDPMEPGDEPQYKLSLIWHKDDERKLKSLRAKIEEVAVEKWGKKAIAMLDKGQLKSPIVDGDTKNADWLDDHWMFTAKSSDKPDVVDADLEDIINSTELYPGAMGRMDVYLYPYDKRGNKGVGAIVNNVQKTDDGERKDGRKSAAEAFGDADDGDDNEDYRGRRRSSREDDDRPSRRKKGGGKGDKRGRKKSSRK